MKRARVKELLFGPFGHEHFGQRLAHARAFDRIVVDEDHGLEPEIQIGREIEDVLGLVGPVDLPSDEVFLTEHHLGMLEHRLERDRLFVLAHDAEDDAPALQVLDRSLKVHERLAEAVVPTEPESIPPDVSHDPAPQRIVEIENEQLAWASGKRSDRGTDV